MTITYTLLYYFSEFEFCNHNFQYRQLLSPMAIARIELTFTRQRLPIESLNEKFIDIVLLRYILL